MKTSMLTVFIQEVVLDVLAEEFLYGLTDLLLLLQDVLVILSVVPLGDSWEHTETPSLELQLNFIIASKLARWVQVQLKYNHIMILSVLLHFWHIQFRLLQRVDIVPADKYQQSDLYWSDYQGLSSFISVLSLAQHSHEVELSD